MPHPTPCPRASTTPLRQSAGLRTVLRASTAPGQGLVEYALLLLFIAIVVVGAMTILGVKTSTMYLKADCAFDRTQAGCPSSSSEGARFVGANSDGTRFVGASSDGTRFVGASSIAGDGNIAGDGSITTGAG